MAILVVQAPVREVYGGSLTPKTSLDNLKTGEGGSVAAPFWRRTRRRDGNAAFARGAYAEASRAYTDALTRARGDGRGDAREDALDAGEDAAGAARGDGDAATCLANRAACWLKLERYEDAARDCDEAIAIDGTYAKAYARRARAREALGDEEGALEDWERTRALAPRDATARDETRRLKPVVERKREEMKREMLDKMKDLGNSLLGNFGLSLDNFKAEKDATTGSYSIQFVNEKKRSTTGDEDDEDDEN